MTKRDFAMEAAETLAEEGLIEQYQGADDEREAIENSRRRERAIRIIRPIIEAAQAAARVQVLAEHRRTNQYRHDNRGETP